MIAVVLAKFVNVLAPIAHQIINVKRARIVLGSVPALTASATGTAAVLVLNVAVVQIAPVRTRVVNAMVRIVVPDRIAAAKTVCALAKDLNVTATV